jgi:5'-3' exonuclease
MGIKNLHKFLRKHAYLAYKEIPLSEYTNKIIAIDINVYLYKYKSIYKENWFNTFINLLFLFNKHNIKPIFIYDTKAPLEKNSKKEERRNRKKNAEKRIRELQYALIEYESNGKIDPLLEDITEKYNTKIKKLLHPTKSIDNNEVILIDKESIKKEIKCLDNQVVNITKKDIYLSKQILDIFNIIHFDSESEAETLCSYLCYHKKVDAVLSDDTDVIVYKTPIFLTKLNIQRESCIELKYVNILNYLQYSPNQFTDFCIMCGTDYNKNIYRLGNEKAYKLLQVFESLDELEKKRLDLDIRSLNYQRIREIFTVPDNIDEKYNFENNSNIEPNMNTLQIFLAENNISPQIFSSTEQVTKVDSNLLNENEEKYIMPENIHENYSQLQKSIFLAQDLNQSNIKTIKTKLLNTCKVNDILLHEKDNNKHRFQSEHDYIDNNINK